MGGPTSIDVPPVPQGDVAGGVVELVIIVGGGKTWLFPVVSVEAVVEGATSDGPLSDAVEDVDGLCSWR